MMTANKARWVQLSGGATFVAIVVASLIPAKMQLRTGLPWQVEHFLAYFLATSIVCLAWPRPFLVAVTLMAFAGALEALQGLTPDRVPDLPTALSGAGGVLATALLAKLLIEAKKVALAQPKQI